jgi:hypothetical protein
MESFTVSSRDSEPSSLILRMMMAQLWPPSSESWTIGQGRLQGDSGVAAVWEARAFYPSETSDDWARLNPQYLEGLAALESQLSGSFCHHLTSIYSSSQRLDAELSALANYLIVHYSYALELCSHPRHTQT